MTPRLGLRFAPCGALLLAASVLAEPPRSRELHHGIDVSGHSGSVDWARVVAAGHSFAFVKSTEGVDLVDPAFAHHWRDLQSAGLIRGAYHFYVTEDDPLAQAQFFLAPRRWLRAIWSRWSTSSSSGAAPSQRVSPPICICFSTGSS